MTFCLCGHDAGSHNRLRFNCLAVSDQNLRCSCSKFEPARDPEQNVGKSRGDSVERGETSQEIRPAAPTGEEAAYDPACPRCSHPASTHTGFHSFCRLSEVGVYRLTATAQATELAALRARVEEIAAYADWLATSHATTLHEWADEACRVAARADRPYECSHFEGMANKASLIRGRLSWMAKDLRAALAPRQTTGDKHAT